MPYPTGTPVAEQVLEGLRVTLAAITAPSYYTTVVAVHRDRGDNSLDLKQVPAILLLEASTEEVEDISPMIGVTATVIARCVLDRREDSQAALKRFAADVKLAIRNNYTLATAPGDGPALDAQPIGAEYYQTEPLTSPRIAVDVTVRIRYRYDRDDPNTPR